MTGNVHDMIQLFKLLGFTLENCKCNVTTMKHNEKTLYVYFYFDSIDKTLERIGLYTMPANQDDLLRIYHSDFEPSVPIIDILPDILKILNEYE